MPKLHPISRRELIRRMKQLGFEGPFPGTRHDFMRRPSDQMKVPIPRAEGKSREIGVKLQKIIMGEINVRTEDWLSLE